MHRVQFSVSRTATSSIQQTWRELNKVVNVTGQLPLIGPFDEITEDLLASHCREKSYRYSVSHLSAPDSAYPSCPLNKRCVPGRFRKSGYLFLNP